MTGPLGHLVPGLTIASGRVIIVVGLSADGTLADPEAVAAASGYAEIRLYTAHVLRHVPEEPLQPVPMGQVFLADEADVNIALRMDGYLKELGY